jgi:glycosyltransferase involved in cell wall biosynthesis
VRIVQAAGWYLPGSIGGTEVYVSELARRLRDAGHEVLIAAPEALGQEERTYEDGGFSVYRYPIPARVTRDEAQGRVVVRGAERFHAWLHRTKPDVVHIHTYVTGLGLAEVRAAKAAGARVIATTHAASLGFTCQRGTMMRWGTMLCDGAPRPGKCAACQLHHSGMPRPMAIAVAMIPQRIGGLFRSLPQRFGTVAGMTNLIAHNQRSQREMLDLVDSFVVLSDWARNVLIANGAPPKKVVLNRLGIRFPAAAAPARRSGSPLTIAYVGRFDPIKGALDFARAIAFVPRSAQMRFEFHGPVRFLTDLAELDRIKAMVGPDAWVRFGGELDAEGIGAALRRIDVVCCPSRSVEGGPTIALEAQAAGVPVIGSNVPALSELVRDGIDGRLYPAGDARALAAILTEIAADPNLVNTWRSQLPAVRTMDDVARDYLGMYAA